jgi:hypothetical protein
MQSTSPLNAMRTNAQPKLPMTQPSTEVITRPRFSEPNRPQITNTQVSRAEPQKTAGSTLSRRRLMCVPSPLQRRPDTRAGLSRPRLPLPQAFLQVDWMALFSRPSRCCRRLSRHRHRAVPLVTGGKPAGRGQRLRVGKDVCAV